MRLTLRAISDNAGGSSPKYLTSDPVGWQLRVVVIPPLPDFVVQRIYQSVPETHYFCELCEVARDIRRVFWIYDTVIYPWIKYTVYKGDMGSLNLCTKPKEQSHPNISFIIRSSFSSDYKIVSIFQCLNTISHNFVLSSNIIRGN